MRFKDEFTKNGYTFIELLVGISIITIVFTIGYVGYRDFSRREALSGVTKSIKADLRLAQQLALTGQKPEVSLGQCTTLEGYTVLFLLNSYSVTANCSNDDIEIKNTDLPTDITETNNLSIKYKVLGQGTDLPDDLTLTITNSSMNSVSTVILGKGGEVN